MRFVHVAILVIIVPLTACRLSISEREVFQPNPYNRRDLDGPLVLDNENRLPPWVTLHHARQASAIGPIATTLAETPSDRLIVHCGGNASDRKTGGVFYLAGLLEFGDVLLFDYPGYGDSAGTATAGEVEAALDEIAEIARAREPDELVLWGQSLGGFVCASLATRLLDQVQLMVFETTARNAEAVAESWTPWFMKPFMSFEVSDGLDAWDNVHAMEGFSGRILVLGAAKDRVLPVELSRDLARDLEAAGHDVRYVEFDQATHMTVPRQPGYREAVGSAL